MVEHSTADREVPSSNLGAPFNFINDIMFFKSIFPCIIASYTRGLVAQWIAHLTSDQKVAGSSPVWVVQILSLLLVLPNRKETVEEPGIEPGASRMRSGRSTTELLPQD